MMTNLLHGAHVANKLFSTIARLRLLLVMFLTLTVSAEVWGETTNLTQSIIYSTGSANNGYASYTFTVDGRSWNAYAIKNKHSNATKTQHYLQIKKYASSIAYYIQIPTMPGKITSIKMTVGSTQQPMSGGGNTATLYFSNKNSTSTTGTGVASGTGDKTVTIDCSALNLTSGYITASAGVRIWDVAVTYETAAATVPVTGVSLNISSLTLTEGDYETLTATVTPANATDQTVTWSTSDANIATVSNGRVTAIAEGSATITVKTTDGNKTATCKVTVNPKPKYTVTLVPGSGSVTDTELEEESAGAGVPLPTPTLDCGDWEFAGWKTTSAVTTETTTEPTLIPAGNYKPSNNITLYAVYQRETTSGGGGGNTSVTFTDEDSGGWTTTAGEQNGTKDGVSISTTNGIYSQNNNQLRVYNDATFTVSSENIITSIVFSSSNYEWSSTSNGVYSDKTWTGNTKSVTFTAGNGQVRITQLVVTVSAGGGSTTYYHSTPDCGSTQPTVYLIPKCGCDGGGTWLVVIEWFATF